MRSPTVLKGQIVRGCKSGWLSSFFPPFVVCNRWFLGTGWDLLYPSVVTCWYTRGAQREHTFGNQVKRTLLGTVHPPPVTIRGSINCFVTSIPGLCNTRRHRKSDKSPNFSGNLCNAGKSRYFQVRGFHQNQLGELPLI